MDKFSKMDAQILELWKEYNCSSAYTQGFNDKAGSFFVPTEENIKKIIKRASQLKDKAVDILQLKVLNSIIQELEFDEPQMVLELVLGSIFNHMVKEGIVADHMKSLLQGSIQAVKITRQRYISKETPIGVKVLTMYRLDGILGILNVVSGSTEDSNVKQLCSVLADEVKSFVNVFNIDDFGHGEFEKVQAIFEKHGFDLGRSSIYSNILKNAYDYHESPEELEQKAIDWLEKELKEITRLIPSLAKRLNCNEDYEDISKAINSRFQIKPEDLIQTTKKVRETVMKFVNEKVARINPNYDTRVIETPKYLTGTIPSAAAAFFDTFTSKPFQLYFVTTDKTRDPMKSLPDLINTLVHEEYGHCLHHSNSATGFIQRPRAIEMVNITLEGPITEGLSFNRELEFLEAFKALEKNRAKTQAEKEMLNLADKYGGISVLADAYEFETRRWRLIRFLRVIGDVRLNTGKQGILEFLDWAEKKTGLKKASIYYQLFPAHEYFPGYATCYAVVGQEIRSLEAIVPEEKRLEFQTYLCSIGSPPRSIYIKRLKSFAESLSK